MAARPKKKKDKTPNISIPGTGLLAEAARGINRQKIANSETVKKKVKKAKPKESKIKQGDTTAKSPPGLEKSDAQGKAELNALRRKRAERMKKKRAG